MTLAVIATFTWMLLNLIDVAAAFVVLTNQPGYRQAIFCLLPFLLTATVAARKKGVPASLMPAG